MSERIVVRCYSSYRDAKRAVDRLAVARIPPHRVTVFGRGLTWRRAFTAPRVLQASMAAGAAPAAAATLIYWSLGGLDASFTWLTALLAGAALGAVLGLALGATAWMLTRRGRKLPESGHVDVDHYEVLVELSHADRARELLDGHDRGLSVH